MTVHFIEEISCKNDLRVHFDVFTIFFSFPVKNSEVSFGGFILQENAFYVLYKQTNKQTNY